MGKPLKDTDFLYATTRIRALEKNFLTRERIERMLDAKSDDDAAKVLYECGYGEMSAINAAEWERVIADERDSVYHLIDNLSSVKELCDFFKIKYDYHNVKVLIKAEVTGEDPQQLLINAGRMPAEAMVDAMREQRYNELPGNLKLCVAETRDVLSRTGDPQTADFLLDRECIDEMQKMAKSSRSEFLAKYTELFIDVYNLRAVVRTMRLSREPDFLRSVLVDGGSVAASRLISAITAGSPLEDIYSSTLLGDAAAEGVHSAEVKTPMTAFERLTDNAMLRYLTTARRAVFGEQPLVSYLAAKESEFTTIRTILSGRAAGVSADALRERLRDCYV